ncbi:survival motor neuron protein-like isoform X1 [Conger conger]|uniref:survival motor neuron protein-like isoform X1 n=1 Tax=Conger conger TaxID=82655 RepID=UPI002A5B06B2|nr:survival motor neuron protein-like isoform X1 [Conger conger]
MAECHGDIVFRKDRSACCSAAIADDNSALVKAYDRALKSFQKGVMSEGEDTSDGLNEMPKSGEESKAAEKERTTTCQPWAVGSRCRTVWSEDGLLYPAALVSVEGQRGRVKFDGYGNEQDVELSALLPEHLDQPWREKRWVMGSRCRAVWSGDGLVYPAVLVWRKGDRGRVQFEGYGNEEELELCALLPPEERKRATLPQEVLKTSPASSRSHGSHTDWRKNEKENTTKKQDPTFAIPPACTTDGNRGRDSCLGEPVTGQKDQGKSGSCKERLMGACPPPSPPFDFFPPVPPRFSAQDVLPSTPPPPPPLPGVFPPWGSPGGGWEGLDPDMSSLSSMLLSWYLCGYHTGCYMALQQAKAGCESVDQETHKPDCSYGKHKH